MDYLDVLSLIEMLDELTDTAVVFEVVFEIAAAFVDFARVVLELNLVVDAFLDLVFVLVVIILVAGNSFCGALF